MLHASNMNYIKIPIELYAYEVMNTLSPVPKKTVNEITKTNLLNRILLFRKWLSMATLKELKLVYTRICQIRR